MKVEVEFPGDFASKEIGFIQLGRLMIGPYVARLVFCSDGKTRLAIDKGAVDAGFVVLTEFKESELYGYPSHT